LFGGSNFNGSTGTPVNTITRSTINPDGTLGSFGGGAVLPNLTTPRVGATAAVFGRGIVVCGGQQSAVSKLATCEQFVVGSDGPLGVGGGPPGMLNPREHFQGAAIDGRLSAIGDDFSTAENTPLGPNGPIGPAVNSNPITYFDKSPQKMAIVTGHFDYL